MEKLDLLGLLGTLQQLERRVTIALMYSGLRLPQFRLLNLISQMTEAATVTQISQQLHITRATASVLVNELVRSGALTMIEHPADRRSYHLQLTELGINKLAVARSDIGVLLDKLSAQLPAETIQHLNAFTGSQTR